MPLLPVLLLPLDHASIPVGKGLRSRPAVEPNQLQNRGIVCDHVRGLREISYQVLYSHVPINHTCMLYDSKRVVF